MWPSFPACDSEQAGARALGFTQVSWDNDSGKEPQPWSLTKKWSELTENQKAGAVALGYTEKIWDNESKSEPQPVAFKLDWDQLTTCGEENCVMQPPLYVFA